MQDCQHAKTHYIRKIFEDETVHYAVQCKECRQLIKTDIHDGKLFIKHKDIPPGSVLSEWLDPESTQGGLFDDN